MQKLKKIKKSTIYEFMILCNPTFTQSYAVCRVAKPTVPTIKLHKNNTFCPKTARNREKKTEHNAKNNANPLKLP